MTKKKDHLFYVQDLVKSVLNGATARAACGREKVFTREDFDARGYHNGCATCMTAVAAEQLGDKIVLRKKSTWTELLETAYAEATAPRATYTFTINSKTTSGNWPPLAA